MHARQLNYDAVSTLLLHRRLGDAKRIDAINQSRAIRLQRITLNLQYGVWQHAHIEHKEVALFAILNLELREIRHQRGACRRAVVGACEAYDEMSIRFQAKPARADALFTQYGAHIAEIVFHAPPNRRIHVDFH